MFTLILTILPQLIVSLLVLALELTIVAMLVVGMHRTHAGSSAPLWQQLLTAWVYAIVILVVIAMTAATIAVIYRGLGGFW